MATTDGVCAPWFDTDDVDADCLPTGLATADVVAKATAASDLLYRESVYQWPGVCTSPVIRPRGGHPDGDPSGPVGIWRGDGWWIPQGIDGTLAVNCLGGSSCSCLQLRQILLPGEPVVAITEVKIDGDVLAASAYRLDDWRYLTRTDGGTWPSCQQAHLDDTEPGTWSVVFTYGAAPPPSGVAAAIALATQFALACSDAAGDCALPDNATRASRNGVEFDLTAADLLDDQDNWTVPEVRAFLHAVNPNGLADDGHVRSPELARHRSHA